MSKLLKIITLLLMIETPLAAVQAVQTTDSERLQLVDEKTAFSDFKQRVKKLAQVSYRDIKTIWQWGLKKIKQERISDAEQKRAEKAFKRSGLKVGVAIALIVAILGVSYGVNYFRGKKNELKSQQVSQQEMDAIDQALKKANAPTIIVGTNRGIDSGAYEAVWHVMQLRSDIAFPLKNYLQRALIASKYNPAARNFAKQLLTIMQPEDLNVQVEGHRIYPLEAIIWPDKSYDLELLRLLILRGANPQLPSSFDNRFTIYGKTPIDARRVIDQALKEKDKRAFDVFSFGMKVAGLSRDMINEIRKWIN